MLIYCCSACLSVVRAQDVRNVYSIGFYNLENLFDTIHDKGKNDYEFLPDGTYKWGTDKYLEKLKNIATVLNEMSTDVSPQGVAAVGVCEVENVRVLQDIVNHPLLAHRQWKIVHKESPDSRGVDCALLYNPTLFVPVATTLVPYTSQGENATYKTRGFLTVSGDMAGERVHIIVNHWPSRSAASPVRERAAFLVRAVKDSLQRRHPGAKVIIMGDMNDNPDDRSMSVCLGAKRYKKDVKSSADLYNPWWNILRNRGLGTLKYKGKWNLYDQIVITGSLLNEKRGGLRYHKPEIFCRDYLLHKEGRYKGMPKRTHASGMWLNGYSDHLPVIVYLIKE